MKRIFLIGGGFLLLNIAFFLATDCARAGEENVASEKESKVHQLEAVTVTAQKREEDPQNVPMSVTTIGEMEIEDAGIESVRDVADFVPNFSFTNWGRSHINEAVIRGIRSNANEEASSVGLYVDGVPIEDPREYFASILNIERIEILKGPQGTLYGKNTEGGVINVITKEPGNRFDAKISAEGGSDEKRKLLMAVNGPIKKDTLYFNFAGQYASKDGFIENTVTGNIINDRQSNFGKLGFRWTATEKLELALNMSSDRIDDGANSQNSLSAYEQQGRKVTVDFEGWNKVESDSVSLQASYDLSDRFKLISLSSYRTVKEDDAGDYDYTNYEAYKYHYFGEKDSITFSQEVRGMFETDAFDFLGGAFFSTREKSLKQTAEQASGIDVTLHGKESDAYSVFGQLTIPFLDKFNFTSGLRYDYEEKSMNRKTAGEQLNDDWEEISPKVSFDFNPNSDLMIYASASSGYRSGGFNDTAPLPSQRSYRPEKLWSYEAGVKSSLYGNRLKLNGALFYMDIKNMQVLENLSTGVAYYTNSGKAVSKGLEIEAVFTVSTGLKLSAGFGYTDVTYDEFEDDLGDYSGNQAIYAPKQTFNFSAQYRHDSGMFARGDLIGYSKCFLDKNNDYIRPAYELVNLKVGYEGAHLDAYLYARNLFDEEYDEVGAFNGCYVHYSDPREIGMNVAYRF